MRKYLYFLLSALIIVVMAMVCFIFFSTIYKNEKNKISDLYKQENSEINLMDKLTDENLYPINTSRKSDAKTNTSYDFMIKLSENQIIISDNEGKQVYATEFYCDGINDNDINALKNGIEIDSVEQAFQILESFVS